MDRDNAIRIARQYKDAISGHFNPTKVYLYGSYSKGVRGTGSSGPIYHIANVINLTSVRLITFAHKE